MTVTEEQKFLHNLESELWTSADKLRSTLDAAQYKHVVLGLIFIKYVSDSFKIRQDELRKQFKDPEHEYFFDPDGYDEQEYQEELEKELEERDYYKEANIFWVPKVARWEILEKRNKQVMTTKGKLWVVNNEILEVTPQDEAIRNKCKVISSVGQLIDHTLEVIEKENSRLKGVLNKSYTQLQIDQKKLGELIDQIATIPFNHKSLNAKDILGHVYEYFLGQFALAEGKKGGQYYTPKSIVTLIVEMLEPFKGRVYDPAMGSGGFFVQSERFIAKHQGSIGNVSIYGQEYNHTTWQLAAMNMAIRGIDFNFGKEPANTFTDDQHKDLRADYVMANPPFNMKEWDTGVQSNDPRWKYGVPPSGNANFAWLQHMLWHLAPNGSLALLLANGSMNSNTRNEGKIRQALVENDLIECMIALPGQLFTNTQIPACIWFLTKNKQAHVSGSGRSLANRSNKVLFIDARNFGELTLGTQRLLLKEETDKIKNKYHDWQSNNDYQDVTGFCKSVNIKEIANNDFILTPSRYVGLNPSKADTDDNIPYTERIKKLSKQLSKQFAQNQKLEQEVKKYLLGLGINVE